MLMRDSNDLKNRFWKFINNKDFSEACKYCYGTYNSDSGILGEQLINSDK